MHRAQPLIRFSLLLVAWSAVCGAALGRAERDLGNPTRGEFPRRAESAASKDDTPSKDDSASKDDDAAPKDAVLASFQRRLCRLETRLFADADDRRWDEFSLLGAALVASGVQDFDTLRHYQRRQERLIGELQNSGKLAGTPRHRAEVVFEFMHRRVLDGGYQIDATDLRMALDRGRFNCVSASVLFGCLARETGLDVRGLEAPGHAMSRLILPDGSLEVETTCPTWFRLVHDPKRRAEAVEKTIGRDPSKSPSQPREVSPVEMIAMIYYNRGVDLLAQRQFEQAAVANAKALRLDAASTTARGNLLATINNWAIALGGSGHYAEAADLLRQGLALEPHYETLSLNYAHVHHQWISHLVASGHRGRADQMVQEAMDDPYLRRQ